MIFIGNRYEITDRPVYIEENKLYNAYDSEKKIDVYKSGLYTEPDR